MRGSLRNEIQVMRNSLEYIGSVLGDRVRTAKPSNASTMTAAPFQEPRTSRLSNGP